MATDGAKKPRADERLQFGERAWPIYRLGIVLAIVGLAASLLLGYFQDDRFRRFYFSYLTSFAFFLSLAVGALFFVLMQFLTRAGWSVSVRRIAEVMGTTMPILGIMSTPILVSVLIHRGDLYPWALPLSAAAPHAEVAGGHDPADVDTAPKPNGAEAQAADHRRVLDEDTLEKRAFLNPTFFIIRVILYFVIWSGIAVYYWRQSVLQDETREVQITDACRRTARRRWCCWV